MCGAACDLPARHPAAAEPPGRQRVPARLRPRRRRDFNPVDRRPAPEPGFRSSISRRPTSPPRPVAQALHPVRQCRSPSRQVAHGPHEARLLPTLSLRHRRHEPRGDGLLRDGGARRGAPVQAGGHQRDPRHLSLLLRRLRDHHARPRRRVEERPHRSSTSRGIRPVNRGTLCPKGASLVDFVHSRHRLTHPEYRGPGGTEWRQVSWDWALDRTSCARTSRSTPVCSAATARTGAATTRPRGALTLPVRAGSGLRGQPTRD